MIPFNPDNFYFKDLDHIYSAIKSVQSGKKVFDGLDFILFSEEYHLPNDQIRALIETGGGRLIKLANVKKKDAVVGIVRKPKEEKKKLFETEVKNARKQGFDKLYTIEFILASCESQSVDWSKDKA